jgi:hypothetical protein
MYALVRRGKPLWGKSAEIIRQAREGLLPTLSRLPGFVSYDIMSLPDDTLLATTLFDTKEAADQANQSFVLWVREQELASLFMVPPEPMVGQVLVHVTKREEETFLLEPEAGEGM